MGLCEGKVAVVTGGGAGVGRAIALALAREGASVVVNDLGCDTEGRGADASVAEAVATEIVRAGGQAVASSEDAAEPGVPDKLVELAIERYGRVDVAVAAAGIAREASILKLSDGDLEAVMRTQVFGAARLLRAAGRVMAQRGEGGAIVLCTGAVGFFGAARQASQATASAAVAGLVRSAALDLRRQGVRVNAIAPTARTRMTQGLPLFQGIREDSMTPDHVAPVAVFLATDLAADVHGEILGVAGGRVYAFRIRETTGAFAELGAFTPEAVRAAWAEIARG